ncbi:MULTISPECIES: hypothetical protein [unclassified Rhizobium]|uniref:hypothetical protein n=1 Tax=unclassified Rhizobium TaxID=2613769 RepID=UPI000B2729C0|nr:MULTISPECIES: hypothetical protein [unclassified Rhizobium]
MLQRQKSTGKQGYVSDFSQRLLAVAMLAPISALDERRIHPELIRLSLKTDRVCCHMPLNCHKAFARKAADKPESAFAGIGRTRRRKIA